MGSKRPSVSHLPALPSELWLSIFHHATHVPGTLIPDVYAHVSFNFGTLRSKSSKVALRDALVTKRAIVRVCKEWWHLAIPSLYTSVYIGKARSLSSLSSTLVCSAAGESTLVSRRPLGEYTQRLDVAIREPPNDAFAECHSFIALIKCMPHLAIVSFAMSPTYLSRSLDGLPDYIWDALHHSAVSLRVLDWSSAIPRPSALRIMDLLPKCVQLRVLGCPSLVWSKDFGHGGIPLTVTTLRVDSVFSVQLTRSLNLPLFGPNPSRHPGPSALRELILRLNWELDLFRDLLDVYSSQLVSVQLYMPNISSTPADVDAYLQLLTHTCPHLRRLTLTSDRFPIISPLSVFPPVTYLGLRATQPQLPRPDFEILFGFLGDLMSSVPSLQVVQLVNERNVQCLLKTHSKLAVRELRPFMEASPFRLEDHEGVLLTGSRSLALGGNACVD